VTGCTLVFGMPRSGTTWIGKLFDSHPNTLYRHEPDSVKQLGMPLFPDKQDAARFRDELQKFVAALPKVRSVKVVGKQPLFAKCFQSRISLTAYKTSVFAAKVAGHVWRDFPCIYRPAPDSGHARLVWKSIESAGRLGVCLEALPSALAIHLMRHPCGYVASVMRGEAARRFTSKTSSADDLWVLKRLLETKTGRSRGIDIGDIKQLTPEERLAWRWLLIHEKILADVEGSTRVLSVRYEDVCADPFAMTQRMFEFTKLGWHSQTEAFVRASTQPPRGLTDTDYYSVFKSPQISAERWRTELAPEVIERVLRVVRSSPLHRYYPDEARTPTTVAEAAT